MSDTITAVGTRQGCQYAEMIESRVGALYAAVETQAAVQASHNMTDIATWSTQGDPVMRERLNGTRNVIAVAYEQAANLVSRCVVCQGEPETIRPEDKTCGAVVELIENMGQAQSAIDLLRSETLLRTTPPAGLPPIEVPVSL